MNQFKSNMFIIISWITLAGIIILFSVQTHSVNRNMIIFLIIAPTLLNLPLFFKSHNKSTTNFQVIIMGINSLIFILTITIAIIETTYVGYVRWGSLAFAVMGLISNIGIFRKFRV